MGPVGWRAQSKLRNVSVQKSQNSIIVMMQISQNVKHGHLVCTGHGHVQKPVAVFIIPRVIFGSPHLLSSQPLLIYS